eukprot:scaffold932_cov299-Prasinococcus_capsulatus_cf.AAC.6
MVEEEEDEKKPFRCNLDVGLARTSTGARVFGALKVRCSRAAPLQSPHSPPACLASSAAAAAAAACALTVAAGGSSCGGGVLVARGRRLGMRGRILDSPSRHALRQLGRACLIREFLQLTRPPRRRHRRRAGHDERARPCRRRC